jgi:hypothetical protein
MTAFEIQCVTKQHSSDMKPYVHLYYYLTKQNDVCGNILILLLYGYASFGVYHGCKMSFKLLMYCEPLW